ncbi:MAG TPA: hypothetical protein VGB04_10640 [Allosphingosinicella sp.]|jgi:hypothetical protein
MSMQSNGFLGKCQDDGGPAADSQSSCNFNIHVEAAGDVHIHNNCASDPAGEPPCPVPPGFPCPTTGTCIPATAGAKHKQSREQKLARRLANDPIASALATSVVHAMRRFVLGKTAENSLEEETFAILRKLPPEFVACVVDGVGSLPSAQRDKVLVSSLLEDTDRALDQATLAQAVASEIELRARLELFGTASTFKEERPGLIRVVTGLPPTSEDFNARVRICRINNLRTANYVPPLAAGEYLPEEIQIDCAPVFVAGEPKVVCDVRTTDCPGHPLAGACGRVVDVGQGDGVLLQGINFFSVDSKVRLTDKDTRTITREVAAFVVGDISTPLHEIVDGNTQFVADCRVADKLTFQVPADLPAGIYEIQVIVPNLTGDPAFGISLLSNVEYIHVQPAPNARFQMVVERILAVKETSPDWAGSDEVGLHTLACALDLDMNLTPVTSVEFDSLDGVDFDSGTKRDVETGIFTSEQPIGAMVVAVLGYEIDGERAYRLKITEWTTYFIDIIERHWEKLRALIKAVGLDTLIGFGWKGAIILAVGVAVVGAVDLLISFWAPADLIIEDTISLSIVDLERLTNASVPPPGSSFLTGANGISIFVNAGEQPVKLPFHYRETREYRCAEEESKYELRYRYNRIA